MIYTVTFNPSLDYVIGAKKLGFEFISFFPPGPE